MTSRTIELHKRCGAMAPKETEICRLLAEDQRVRRRRSKERLVAPASTSHDTAEKASYLADLWRLACETPDAPHLCND
jgi:hypothetical protein